MAQMKYVLAFRGKQEVGHFDFTENVNNGWLNVRYGTFATSAENSYSEWADSYQRDMAIKVDKECRTDHRGLGSALVSISLYYGKKKGLIGMRIIEPNTPAFWRKLGFVEDGNDLIFNFSNQAIPLVRIKQREIPALLNSNDIHSK
jgi:hypothetical protein